jgi:hypothetical protein
MEDLKKYWLREELLCADELMALVPALTKEFLDYHTDYHTSFSKGKTIESQGELLTGEADSRTVYVGNQLNSWKLDFITYTDETKNIKNRLYLDTALSERYPTATALVKKWDKDCGIAGYSSVEPNSIIERHTGHENVDNEYIRIHIPLIIPKGDIFLECEGVEIDWSDIWGFNNQLTHSVYNNTNERRLAFVIDLRRSTIGLPPEPKYDPIREAKIPPFVRGARPKVYHTCQRK